MKNALCEVLIISAALMIGANVIWMLRNYHHSISQSAVGQQQFQVVTIHTNNAIGTVIIDRHTEKPVWTQWDMDGDGNPDIITCFFKGTNVFNLHLFQGRRPAYDVILYGGGKSQEWLWDNRSGQINDLIMYDTNGDLLGRQIWYADKWWPVERREGHNGIVTGSIWSHISLDTNGNWYTN